MAIWRGAGGSGDATTDAANEASVASTKAAEAEASASAAASSATSAATEAASANNAKIAAQAAQSAAETAQTAAELAETNAETAQAAAELALDSFDDRYLGAKSSAPTVDNDGDALAVGAMYYDTNDDIIYVWNGTLWQTITTGSGGLQAANNLSDVASASTSRTNLGLEIGTDVQAYSAVLDATTASYTTAEETKLAGIETGATADQTASEIMTAIQTVDGTGSGLDADLLDGIDSTGFTQPGDNVSTLTNDAGYLTSFTETNDLTTAVTWANVPDANITQSSVTQHQAALSITESQISDLGTYVTKTSATGSAEVPSGTTAQRDGTPAAGYLRFNTTDSSFEGYDGSAWGAIGGGGGASGGGSDAIFYENGQTITTNYTITSNTNAMSTGPLTVNSGVSVTVPSGSRWVVL
jgi:hypothetical protein